MPTLTCTTRHRTGHREATTGDEFDSFTRPENKERASFLVKRPRLILYQGSNLLQRQPVSVALDVSLIGLTICIRSSV